MYLQAGERTVIRVRDIIGIFDMDSATVSKITKKYLAEAARKHEIKAAGGDLPKSFVLYEEGGKRRICLSKFSPAVLAKRSSQAERTSADKYHKS